MIIKTFTQEELDSLYDSIVYLMEIEQTHYEELLEENGTSPNHIYLKAVEAFNALKREEI